MMNNLINSKDGFAINNSTTSENKQDILPTSFFVESSNNNNSTTLVSAAAVNSTDISILEDYEYDVSESYDNYDWVILNYRDQLCHHLL